MNDTSAEFLRKIDDDAFAELIKQQDGIISPLDLIERTERFYDDGYSGGMGISIWPEFSDHFRVARREMTVITGIPGHGKSEFLDAIMMHMAMGHNEKFAIFSPENYPQEIHMEKLLSKWSGLPFHRGRTERMDRSTMATGACWLNEHFKFLSADEKDTTLEWIFTRFKRLIKNEGFTGVVIDPWNEVELSRPPDISDTDFIGRCLMKCRRFGRENNVSIFIVAHPTKINRDKDTGRTLLPRAYDIAGSSNWFNKADNILCVYREQDNTVTVHIQKIKFKIRGHVGEVKFNYDPATGLYTEKDVDKNALPND